jgi:hypothetical protein
MADYKIITDYSNEHLEISISSYLKRGWSLVGGVSMVATDHVEGSEYFEDGETIILYGQAVYKP